MKAEPHDRFSPLLVLLLVAVGFIVYANTLRVPFYFDDVQNISENSAIRLSSLEPGAMVRALTKSPSPSRPVANLSFALNHYLHGYWLPGYHLVNIVVHLLAAVFLFLLLARTLMLPAVGCREGEGRLVAFLAAAVWLVHPVQTQAVTYVVQRMTSLAGMFFLLSLLCYVRGRESRREEGAGGRGWFAGAAAAGLLALGAKETAITLPFFVFLYEWYFFRDLDRRWLQKSLPTVAVALVIVLLGCLLYAKGHPWRLVVDSYAYRDFSLTERVLTQWRVLFFYLSLLCYPHPGRLSLDHDFLLSRSLIQPPTTLASLVGLLALVAVGVVIARRQRLLSFAIFWFLGNLFLTSSIIGIELVFEHRLYLPSAFLVAAVTLLLFRVVRCRAAAIGILSLAVILLGYWTYSRNQTWRDPVAFHRDLVRKAPAKSRPHYNLGVELMGHAGFEQEAIAEFSRALALEPRLLMAHSQLGLAYGRIGALDQAIFHFRQVLALQPDDVAANFTIGVLFRQKGDLVRARDHLFRALQHAPDDVTIMTNLALLFHHSGNLPAALSFYRQAIARQPGNADILNNIGVILREEGRLAQAEQYFRRALAIAPAHPQARANLQGVLAAEPSAR